MKKSFRVKSPLVLALGLSILMSGPVWADDHPRQSPPRATPQHDQERTPPTIHQQRSQQQFNRAERNPPPATRPTSPIVKRELQQPYRTAPPARAQYDRTTEYQRPREYQRPAEYVGRHPAHADLRRDDFRAPPKDMRVLRHQIASNRNYLTAGPRAPDRRMIAPGKRISAGVGRRLPEHQYHYLPRYTGYEWRSVGQDLILVAVATGIIYTVFENMVPR